MIKNRIKLQLKLWKYSAVYVRTCNIVSFKYLQRKKEQHPGIDIPGINFFFITASAIFMKNCDISESDKLIFFPCSCNSFVFFISEWAPKKRKRKIKIKDENKREK